MAGDGPIRRRDLRAPTRTCVVSRVAAPPDELIRFVVDPHDTVVPDIARKLPGRGVWVGCRKELVARAVKQARFARGFRRKVSTPADLADRVERLLAERAAQMLALANKAGCVVAGHMKVDGAVAAGWADVVVQASDAADGGVERLARKFAAVSRGLGHEARVLRILTVDEMSLALGRPNVVHVCLGAGRAAETFALAGWRLERYRSAQPFNGGATYSDDPSGTIDGA